MSVKKQITVQEGECFIAFTCYQWLPLFVMILYSFVGDAQSLYREGFIVTNSGDSIRGVIHDEEWKTNPISIHFRETGKDTEEELSVAQIKAFYTNRKIYYERVNIRYDADIIALNSFANTRQPEIWKEGVFFLTTLVKSDSFSLHKFIDERDKVHYFLTDGKGKSQELLNRKYNTKVENKTGIITSNEWKQQLLNEMTLCPSVTARIKTTAFAEPVLKSLVRNYNKCVGSENRTLVDQQYKPERRPPAIFAVFNGFTDKTGFYFAASNKGHVAFGGGVAIEVYSRKKPNRLSIYNEVKYINLDQSAINQVGLTPVDFKLNLVNLVVMVRQVLYLGDQIKIYGKIGPLAAYRFGASAVNRINGYDLANNNRTGFVFGGAIAIGTEFSIIKNRSAFFEIRGENEGQSTYTSLRVGAAVGVRLF